jgi:hypothetical protein
MADKYNTTLGVNTQDNRTSMKSEVDPRLSNDSKAARSRAILSSLGVLKMHGSQQLDVQAWKPAVQAAGSSVVHGTAHEYTHQ